MIRQSFTDLNSTQRDSLATAFNGLWAKGFIQSNADLHDTNFRRGIHWGPAFLPWHRDYLRKLELELQSFDRSLNLPYWDWTRVDSKDIDSTPWKEFLGGRPNSGGKFDHWSYTRNNVASGRPLPNLDDVVKELDQSSFLQFRSIETGSHVPGHTWVGGSMATGKSPLDPLFYMHHCNIDRIWAIWQINNSNIEQYEHTGVLGSDSVPQARVPLNSNMIGGATPSSMLDHAALGYSYGSDLPLEKKWKEKKGTDIKTKTAAPFV